MVKWAILGAGNIAHRFSKSLAQVEDAKLIGIYARNKEKAAKFCEEFGVEKAYEDEYELLNDKDVDAVYVPLINSLHYKWVVEALKHSKAVMVEKPAFMSKEEAVSACECAKENNVLFMEALKTRFVPGYKKIKEIIESGELGKVVRIDTVLSSYYSLEDLKKTHLFKSFNGGGLLDSGPYCACYHDDFLDGVEVINVESRIVDGVDMHCKAAFNNGSIETGLDEKLGKKCHIICENGEILVKDLHRPVEFKVIKNGEVTEYNLPYEIDDFYGQIVHFCELLKEGKKESEIVPFKTTINMAEIFDKISAKFN